MKQTIGCSTSPPFMHIIVGSPAIIGKRRQYKGYPSSLVNASSWSWRGYLTGHFAFSMRGEFLFKFLEGPWITCIYHSLFNRNNVFNFWWNTRTVMSWRSIRFCPSNNSWLISTNFWFVVNVIKTSGRSYLLTTDIASWARCTCWGDPVKVEVNITLWPLP